MLPRAPTLDGSEYEIEVQNLTVLLILMYNTIIGRCDGTASETLTGKYSMGNIRVDGG
jgi:hypothetical protein